MTKKERLILSHYNFFQAKEVNSIADIPIDVFTYLSLLDETTLVRPRIYELAKRDLNINALSKRFKVSPKAIVRSRKAQGICYVRKNNWDTGD